MVTQHDTWYRVGTKISSSNKKLKNIYTCLTLEEKKIFLVIYIGSRKKNSERTTFVAKQQESTTYIILQWIIKNAYLLWAI